MPGSLNGNLPKKREPLFGLEVQEGMNGVRPSFIEIENSLMKPW